jgi:hypothetical protein
LVNYSVSDEGKTDMIPQEIFYIVQITGKTPFQRPSSCSSVTEMDLGELLNVTMEITFI